MRRCHTLITTAVVELYTGSLAADGDAGTYLGMITVDAERIAAGLTG